MAKTWFRVHASGHRSILDNRKVQSLQPADFMLLVNLWALSCPTEGVLPPVADIAWRLRMKEAAIEAAIDKFLEKKLIDAVDDYFVMHDWNDHQFESDSSTDRVKRFRQRSRNAVDKLQRGESNVDETPLARVGTRSESESVSESVEGGVGETFALAPPTPSPKRDWRQESFDRFWRVVWLRVGKDAARRAWNSRVKFAPDAEAVIAAAESQGPRLLAEARKHDRTPIHPATWLNQGRWQDEQPPDASAAVEEEPDYDWRNDATAVWPLGGKKQ